jgi:hypothetical protein
LARRPKAGVREDAVRVPRRIVRGAPAAAQASDHDSRLMIFMKAVPPAATTIAA